MKDILDKYQDYIRIVVLFLCVYLVSFFFLEKWDNRTMIITDILIDSYIPFNEYFVVPYLLWFVFMIGGFLFFIFKDQDGFKRTCFYLFGGMIVCLIIYFLFPNAQNQRPELLNENIFETLVSYIYTIDSSTNVCPSIHVYNSIMMSISLLKSQMIQKHKSLTIGIQVLCLLICLSTVMIKQHTLIDVMSAIFLCLIMYKLSKIYV